MKKVRKIMCFALATLMLTSAVPIVSATEQDSTLPKSAVGDKATESSDSQSSESKYYSLDDVNTDYLYSKTDSPAVKSQSDELLDLTQNANSSNVLNTEDMFDYSDFGFSDSAIESGVEAAQSNESYDNPLKDVPLYVPSELLISSINRGDNHKGEITAYNETDDMSKTSNIDSLDKAVESVEITESDSGQTHNSIGIDVDGDGVDEVVYSSLYGENDKGKFALQLYKNENSKLVSKDSISPITIQEDDWILSLEAQDSKGYTSMTAGDFDNDGKEELAVYIPQANKNSANPYIAIYDFDGLSFNESSVEKIYLSDATDNSDINNLQKGDRAYDDQNLPVVGLSTTSIRSSDKENDAKNNKTVNSYDDLVINISIPRCYEDEEDNMNSSVAVFSKRTGSWNKECCYDLASNSSRMIFNNSVDADLNGDGYKELVVAGWYETGLNGSNSNGTISENEALVQLITWDGSKYSEVWSENPDDTNGMKKVSFSGELELEDNQEPIALTAGHYSSLYADSIDSIVVNGSVNTLSGATIYASAAQSSDSSGTVADTEPYHDTENFKSTDSKTVKFKNDTKMDLTEVADAGTEPFISTADTGTYLEGAQNDVIVLLAGSRKKAKADIINYHILFMYCDDSGAWHTQVHEDYMDDVDEDDNGTSISVCFANVDEDTSYFEYIGKSVGYSSPTLYSVIQAPPYYDEVNSASTKCTISYGYSAGTKGNWGVGLSLGFASTEAFTIPGIVRGSLSVSTDWALNYSGYKLALTSVNGSRTLEVPNDQDYVIVFATPMVYNYYNQYYLDENKNYTSELTYTVQTLEPRFVALSVEDYNKAAQQLVDDCNAQTDDEAREYYSDLCTAAPVIDNLPTSDAGNVNGYGNEGQLAGEIKDYYGVDITDDDDDHNSSTIDVGTVMPSNSSSLEFSTKTEVGNGFDIKGSIGVSASLKGGIIFLSTEQTAKAALSKNGGCTWVSGNTEGISMNTTFTKIPSSDSVSIYSSDANDSYSTINQSNIVHYDPDNYHYTAGLVSYYTDKICNTKIENVENESGISRNNVYMMSYYIVDQNSIPRELPEYFGIEKVEKSDDNQNYEITLAWRDEATDSEREADAFNIYVQGQNTTSFQLLNKDKPIENTKNGIQSYTISDLPINNASYSYFITSVEKRGETNTYIETISSPIVTVTPSKFFVESEGIVIKDQPSIQTYSKDGDEVTFTTSAYYVSNIENDSEENRNYNVSYSWQKFNSQTQKWEYISGEHSSTLTLKATESGQYTPYRCEVSYMTSSSVYQTQFTNSVTYYKESVSLTRGDVNGDGRLSVLDVTIIQKYLVDIREYNDQYMITADVDFDGVITINDAAVLQKMIVGIYS